MDNKDLQAKWPAIKNKIKALHPDISESDLILEIGKEAELLKRLQTKLGKNSEEIRNWLSLMG